MEHRLTIFTVLVLSNLYQIEASSYTAALQTWFSPTGEEAYPVVTVSAAPRCNFVGRTGDCCMTIGIPAKGEDIDSCIKVEYINNRRAVASFSLQGIESPKREVTVGETCSYVAGSSLKSCMNVYYQSTNLRRNINEACFFVHINEMIMMDYECIKNNNGLLSHNSDHTAESEGILDLEYNDGKPAIKYRSLLPSD